MKLMLNAEEPINGKYSFTIDLIKGINRCKVSIHGQVVLVIDLPPQFKFPVCVSNDIGCSLFLEFREINSSDLMSPN